MEDNPFPAVMGRVCYHPCETVCNRAQLDEAVGINSVERFLGDEAIEQGWQVERRRAAVRKARARRRRRALRALGRLPPRPARPRGDDPRRRPAARRDDALRDPEVPAAARRARRRDRSASSTSGSTLELNTQGRRTSSTAMQDGGFDAVFLAVGAHLGKRAYIPAGVGRAHPRRRLAAAQHGGRGDSRCWAGASSSTAAATPRWTRPGPRSGSAPRRRSSSTGARATACPPTTSRSRRPRRRAC